MKLSKTLTMMVLCTALSACAQTALEEDFGNSVRGMISAQTLNPNAVSTTDEAGDGQRLEGVLGDYRGTVTKRTSVSTETGLEID
jgi:hypothetical protein